VQLDYVKAANPPLAMGIKGTITAGGLTATMAGLLDGRQASIQGTVTLGELGSISVSGVLYHGVSSQLTDFRVKIRDEATPVTPTQNSLRFDGKFSQGKALKGLSAPWDFTFGSVDPSGSRGRVSWATLKGSVSRPGFSVTLFGDISLSGTTLQYTLIGTSDLKVDERAFVINSNPDAFESPAPNALHGAIRPVVFALDPSPASHQQGLEQVKGRLYGSASYTLRIELRSSGTTQFIFEGDADVFYSEAFDRAGDGVSGFNEESRSRWNHPVDINLSINSDTGRACYRWGDAGDFSTIEWGSCD
jgi:hypothetical protein